MINLKKIAAFTFGLGYLMKVWYWTLLTVNGSDNTALKAISITSFLLYNMAVVLMWATISKDLRNNLVLTWISAVFCCFAGEIFCAFLHSNAVHVLQQHCHVEAFSPRRKSVTIDLPHKIYPLRCNRWIINLSIRPTDSLRAETIGLWEGC